MYMNYKVCRKLFVSIDYRIYHEKRRKYYSFTSMYINYKVVNFIYYI